MRRILFWLHLVAGLLAGLVIAVLCFTGVAIAFEKQLIAFAERDVAHVTVPTDPVRLPLDELLGRVRTAQPEARVTAITITREPSAAVSLALGRESGLLADPYAGEIRPRGAARTRAFMHLMTDIHRTLGFHAETTRPVGKAITGAANIVFLVLAVTGLYLWWPRSWSWRGLRAVAVVNLRLTGKARDWNWHNALGLWSAPVLIVLTLTALPISYRWATNLLYTATGSEPPVQTGGPGAQAPGPVVPPPAPSLRPLPLEALLVAAQAVQPGWSQITLRLASGREPGPRGPQAIAVAVRTANQWPRFASTTLHLDPFTGAILRTDTFADQSTGRRLRSWSRFLHTGEALGWPGQLIAALASLAALFLVWTGFALSWRRLFRRGNVGRSFRTPRQTPHAPSPTAPLKTWAS